MTLLLIVCAIILLLRWLGLAEPLAAIAAGIVALLVAGFGINTTAAFIVANAPRVFDYLTICIPLIMIGVALLKDTSERQERPSRPLHWSTGGDIRYFGIYLSLCIVAASQLELSVLGIFESTIAFAVALFVIALPAHALAGGLRSVSLRRILISLVVFGSAVAPAVMPILLGYFTPTEAICIVFLPVCILLRIGFDLVKQHSLSNIIDDAVRGAIDGAWVLLTFFGAAMIAYALKAQEPLALAGGLAGIAPASLLAIYLVAAVACSVLLGTITGFVIVSTLFLPAFREAGYEQAVAIVAVLGLLAASAFPDSNFKITGTRFQISAGQLAGFAATTMLSVAVAFAIGAAGL